MKNLLLILLCLPMIGFGQEKSPCLDARYLELKNKKLDDMSDMEYSYFLKKEEECSNNNTNTSSPFSDEELFNNLTKENNNVYIDSYDEAVIIHATKYIRKWGFWNIVRDNKDADFTLMFYSNNIVLSSAISLQFIDSNNRVFKDIVRGHFAGLTWDINAKRGTVKNLINKELKPLFINNY